MTKLLGEIAAIFGFRMFPIDLNQTYLQSAENRKGDTFIKHPKELNLNPNELIKLLKPLYGLSKSGNYWGRALRSHLDKDLGMTS